MIKSRDLRSVLDVCLLSACTGHEASYAQLQAAMEEHHITGSRFDTLKAVLTEMVSCLQDFSRNQPPAAAPTDPALEKEKDEIAKDEGRAAEDGHDGAD